MFVARTRCRGCGSTAPLPPTTLSARLDELEEAGVLERRVVDARPPRTEYVLTERGERLSALLDALGALGTR